MVLFVFDRLVLQSCAEHTYLHGVLKAGDSLKKSALEKLYFGVPAAMFEKYCSLPANVTHASMQE